MCCPSKTRRLETRTGPRKKELRFPQCNGQVKKLVKIVKFVVGARGILVGYFGGWFRSVAASCVTVSSAAPPPGGGSAVPAGRGAVDHLVNQQRANLKSIRGWA